MNDYQYLYGIAWANCSLPPLGAGVDARFPVESARCGRLAALASCVGLDEFDLAKLQEGTADVPWLSAVAVRHNEIVSQAAHDGPLLPMRVGVVFQSQASLLAKVRQHEIRMAGFLQFLGDGREWAVKVYLDEAVAQQSLLPSSPSPADATPGQGARYLATRRLQNSRAQELQAAVRHELVAVGESLQRLADAWRPLRALPSALVDHSMKMVWNGAFLLARRREGFFQTTCERLHQELAAKGLILEVSGPWPAYHFCPVLDTEGGSGVATPAGR